MESKIFLILNNILLRKDSQNEFSELKKNLSLRNDLSFDSFDLAELSVHIEDEFGIDVFEKNYKIDNIGEILKIIKEG